MKFNLVHKSLSIVLIAMMSWQCWARDAIGIDPHKPFFVTVVIDTSATSSSSWRKIQKLPPKIIALLGSQDRFELFTARTGSPQLHISATLDDLGEDQAQRIYQTLRLKREFLFKADLARAVTAAFKNQDRQAARYQPILIVLTDGKMEAKQLRELRNLATLYKSRQWHLAITVTRNAHRNLLMAGNLDEFQVLPLEQIPLENWLKAISVGDRSEIATEPFALRLKTASPSNASANVPEKPHRLSSAEATDSSSESPDRSYPSRLLLPVYPVPAHPARDEGRVKMSEEMGFASEPLEPFEDQKVPTDQSRWKYLIFGLISLALLLLLYVIVRYLKTAHSSEISLSGFASEVADRDSLTHLIVEYNDQRYELGNLQTIDSLIFGRIAGSAIELHDEALEEKHFRIYNHKQQLKIQHLAHQPITVNGKQMQRKQKRELLLPATIEITPDLKLALYCENLDQDISIPHE